MEGYQGNAHTELTQGTGRVVGVADVVDIVADAPLTIAPSCSTARNSALEGPLHLIINVSNKPDTHTVVAKTYQ